MSYRPNYGGAPVSVAVQVEILTVSDDNNDFTVRMDITQTWTDPRLSFDDEATVEQFRAGKDMAKDVWTPDTTSNNIIHQKYLLSCIVIR